MKYLFIILTSVVCFVNKVISQNWAPVQGGLNFQAKCLYNDSLSNSIFIGGGFTVSGFLNARAFANWDDSSGWLNVNGGMDDPNPVKAIVRYKGQLYVGGSFRRSGGQVTNGFTTWNGLNYDSINQGFHQNGALEGFLIDNNELYCFGSFDSVGSIYSPLAVIWNGTDWIRLGLPRAIIGFGISSAIRFQNDLYFGGHFIDSSGTLYDFVKWDGLNWSKAGGTFTGPITTMAIFNNELYIGGSAPFSISGQYILKFDGTNFTTLNSGVNGPVWRIKIINNKLVVVGTFNQAGNIHASSIAVWDGQNWNALSADTFNNGIADVELYNNNLYAVGGFTRINSDTITYIAKYSGDLSQIIDPDDLTISIFPNPVISTLIVSGLRLNSGSIRMRLYDIFGREYKVEFENEGNDLASDFSLIATGIYFLEIKIGNSRIVRKILVQHI